MTFKGYAKVRRGFLEHIRCDSTRPALKSSEVRLFLAFLLMAEFRGDDAGVVEGTTSELAELSGFTRPQTFSDTAKRLCDLGYIKHVQRGRNQHEKHIFWVTKFAASGQTENDEAKQASTESGVPDSMGPLNENCLPTQQKSLEHPRKLLAHSTETVEATAISDTKDRHLQPPKNGRIEESKNGRRGGDQDSPFQDEEAMLQAIIAEYPKKTQIGRARSAMRDAIAKGREGSPAKWLAKVIAAARICQRFPKSEQGYLPGLPEFIGDDYAADWNSQLEIALAKAKRSAPVEEIRTGPMSPEEELARMRRINAKAARTL